MEHIPEYIMRNYFESSMFLFLLFFYSLLCFIYLDLF